jgi:hypothetical protein
MPWVLVLLLVLCVQVCWVLLGLGLVVCFSFVGGDVDTMGATVVACRGILRVVVRTFRSELLKAEGNTSDDDSIVEVYQVP